MDMVDETETETAPVPAPDRVDWTTQGQWVCYIYTRKFAYKIYQNIFRYWTVHNINL